LPGEDRFLTRMSAAGHQQQGIRGDANLSQQSRHVEPAWLVKVMPRQTSSCRRRGWPVGGSPAAKLCGIALILSADSGNEAKSGLKRNPNLLYPR